MAWPTNSNRHGTNLMPTFHVHERIDIGSPREHLDCRAGALYLPRASWLRDEELNV